MDLLLAILLIENWSRTDYYFATRLSSLSLRIILLYLLNATYLDDTGWYARCCSCLSARSIVLLNAKTEIVLALTPVRYGINLVLALEVPNSKIQTDFFKVSMLENNWLLFLYKRETTFCIV